MHLGGTAEEVAATEREVARGGRPQRPFVLGVQACVADPSRAPVGKSTFWAYCHVPNGSEVDMTAAIGGQIERFAPGFAERVLARHVMGPAAVEAHDANHVGGDIGGGAADLRQFVSRPVPSPRPWRTPVPGLLLCSSSTPPGGGCTGWAGGRRPGWFLQQADPAAMSDCSRVALLTFSCSRVALLQSWDAPFTRPSSTAARPG